MDRENAKQIVKQYEPDFLQRAKQKVNGRYTYICPECGNGSGKSGSGIARNKDKYKCFKCGLNEDIIGLWKKHQGITDDKEVFKTLYEHFNIEIDRPQVKEIQGKGEKMRETEKKTDPGAPAPQMDQKEVVTNFTDFFLKASEDIEKTDYHRGISLDTLKRYKIGYVEEWRHPKAPNSPATPRLIIPITEYSYTARDTRSNIPEEQEQYKKSKVKGRENVSWLFNFNAIKTAKKPIIVVEGEIDALSIIDVGGEAVGLGSLAYTRQFIEYVKNNRPAQPLVISLDNENNENIEKHKEELSQGLTDNNINYYFYNIAGEYKDANDFLLSDREAFKKEIYKAEHREEAEYKQNAVSNQLQGFINGIAESINTPYIPTGFYNIDRNLDGGLYEGLYIIGAISSLGKTTLVLQIADQIAGSGQDVLIYSLEMARAELMSKSISRHTLIDTLENNGKIEHAKTARGITTGKRYQHYSNEERELINRAIANYSKYGDHLYIFEGVGDIGSKQITKGIEEHIRLTGKRPVVIIDYLQILAPEDIRATDKQNTDKAVLDLKRASRDNKVPIIAISSFNRSNYNTKVSMEAFKESGAIEYSSDVLMGLQLKGVENKDFDVDKAKRANPREIELLILKNRNGATGVKIPLEYYPLFNYFKEAESGDNLFTTGSWDEKVKAIKEKAIKK